MTPFAMFVLSFVSRINVLWWSLVANSKTIKKQLGLKFCSKGVGF